MCRARNELRFRDGWACDPGYAHTHIYSHIHDTPCVCVFRSRQWLTVTPLIEAILRRCIDTDARGDDRKGEKRARIRPGEARSPTDNRRRFSLANHALNGTRGDRRRGETKGPLSRGPLLAVKKSRGNPSPPRSPHAKWFDFSPPFAFQVARLWEIDISPPAREKRTAIEVRKSARRKTIFLKMFSKKRIYF